MEYEIEITKSRQEEIQESFPSGTICIAVWETDKAYGGPEEGGWWYDCGVPTTDTEMAAMTRKFPATVEGMEEALKYLETLETAAAARNKQDGRRSPDSVLCDGYFEALMDDGYPKAFPTRRPYYS